MLIALGSINALVREEVDRLRSEGIRAGSIAIRMMRPFPTEELAGALKNAKAIGVLDKDISFGYEGTVYTNVNSALVKKGINIASYNFICGIGGRDISPRDIGQCFETVIEGKESKRIKFIGSEVWDDV